MATQPPPDTLASDPLTTWLLDADPALRWQVERDLLGVGDDVWQATRARVPLEGFGAQLLARQDADGQWAGGAYFPGRPDLGDVVVVGDPEAQPWVATLWALCHLREWGVDAEVLGDTGARLARNCTWEYEDLPFWSGEVDVCINAHTLSNGDWLGRDMSGMVRWFGEHQLPDGGWNCWWPSGSTRSSFLSTLGTVIALLDHEQRTGDPSTVEMRHRGEEYLAERQLLYRKRDGERVGDWVAEFVSPPRYQYSALRALDHFRAASQHDQVAPDPRLADAVDLVRAKRGPDGRWLQDGPLDGIVWFETDAPHGEPSRWLTLQGARVLAWWDDHAEQ
ncbi:squalene cyclase [Propionibacteriaceae bacterium Y2011]|uniref:squalene cyclase n=1 Tax=Microlunatus sp. Y2014 TaxID=3418488 RepID=UPI003B4DB9F6